MTTTGRIPTPLKHRWRRIRYSAMPTVCFVVCAVLTVWLWQEQTQLPNAVAVVEQKSVPVAASADGKIVSLWKSPEAECTIYDVVGKGQLLARLDDSAVQAALATLQTELAGLDKQLAVTEQQFSVDAAGRENDRKRHLLNLEVELGRCQLEVLDRSTRIETDEILLQRATARLQYNQKFEEEGAVSPLELQMLKMECDEIQQRINDSKTARIQAERLRDEAQSRLNDYRKTERMFDVTVLLGPIGAQIATQQARLKELQVQIQTLNIVAPFAGVICQIHCWPDQYVRRGDPIVTLAATGASGGEDQRIYAVAYIRRNQHVQLQPGMKVQVQSRAPGNPRAVGNVMQIGPQFEPVPLQHLRDPAVPEWGRPARIQLQLPVGFHVVPGEMLDVNFTALANKKS